MRLRGMATSRQIRATGPAWRTFRGGFCGLIRAHARSFAPCTGFQINAQKKSWVITSESNDSDEINKWIEALNFVCER